MKFATHKPLSYNPLKIPKWKLCTKCKILKLCNNVFFATNKATSSGYESCCKICKNRKPTHITPTYQQCTICSTSKSCNSKNFRILSQNLSGFDKICKECRLYMESTPDQREKQKLKRNKRSKYNQEYFREYQQNNLDLFRMYSTKRRAVKKSLSETFTTQDIQLVKERFKNKCFVCSSEERLEIDHFFPLSMGYVLTHQNAVLLCKSCNCSKNASHPYEWFSEEQLLELREIYGVY